MVFCGQCGSENEDNNKFCGNCGNNLLKLNGGGAAVVSPAEEKPPLDIVTPATLEVTPRNGGVSLAKPAPRKPLDISDNPVAPEVITSPLPPVATVTEEPPAKADEVAAGGWKPSLPKVTAKLDQDASDVAVAAATLSAEWATPEIDVNSGWTPGEPGAENSSLTGKSPGTPLQKSPAFGVESEAAGPFTNANSQPQSTGASFRMMDSDDAAASDPPAPNPTVTQPFSAANKQETSPAAVKPLIQVSNSEDIPDYFWLALATTLCCCPISGLVSLILSATVKSKLKCGHVDEARTFSKYTYISIIVTVACTVLFSLMLFGLFIIGSNVSPTATP